MKSTDPIVTGPYTKYAGKQYKLGRPYAAQITGTNTNAQSWAIIEAMFALHPVWDFWDLAVACRHHIHGTQAAKGPQSWVRYLIRSGHLVEA
jgi:hypothetical protein